MSLDSGSFALTVFRITDKVPQNILDMFNAHVAEKLDDIGDEQSIGWVSGRHLIEREINETTSMLGGHIYLHLRIAQRKVPAALLKAECRKLELDYMYENKIQHVPSKIRKEIKKTVLEKRTPQMPPSINGIPVAFDLNAKYIYLGSASQKIADIFAEKLHETTKLEPIKLDIDELMFIAAKQKAEAIPSLKFTVHSKDKSHCPGRDFLTWLWFQSETSSKISFKQYGTFELFVDGPFTLAFGEEIEEGGAAETVVRKGNPARSAEVKAALAIGKKLRKAKITLARDKEIWKFTFDADTFSFTGFSLPQGEETDSHGAFAERMTNLSIFMEIFIELFKRFETSLKPENKARTEKEAFHWAQQRDAK